MMSLKPRRTPVLRGSSLLLDRLPEQSWYIYSLSSALSSSGPSLRWRLALQVLGNVSICTCLVLKRHYMMIICVSPLFPHRLQFIISVRSYLWRLVCDGSRSYTDLKRNWIRCGSILQISPQFSFLSDVSYLVYAHQLPMSVALAFGSFSSIC